MTPCEKRGDGAGSPAVKNEMGFFKEFFLFLKERKLWWLIPIIIVLVFLGAIIFVLSLAPSVAPFIYTIF